VSPGVADPTVLDTNQNHDLADGHVQASGRSFMMTATKFTWLIYHSDRHRRVGVVTWYMTLSRALYRGDESFLKKHGLIETSQSGDFVNGRFIGILIVQVLLYKCDVIVGPRNTSVSETPPTITSHLYK
jgi:hypothetical protein